MRPRGTISSAGSAGRQGSPWMVRGILQRVSCPGARCGESVGAASAAEYSSPGVTVKGSVPDAQESCKEGGRRNGLEKTGRKSRSRRLGAKFRSGNGVFQAPFSRARRVIWKISKSLLLGPKFT